MIGQILHVSQNNDNSQAASVSPVPLVVLLPEGTFSASRGLI